MLYLNSGKLKPKEFLEFYEFMSESKLIQKNVESGGILNVIALLFIFKIPVSQTPEKLSLNEILILLDIDKYCYILKEANISIDNIIKYAISSQNSSNPELETRLAKILDW